MSEKKKNMPAAVMTSGTIIGEISSDMKKLRAGIWDCDRPRAASVPSDADRAVAQMAMNHEFLVAWIHWAFCQESASQAQENFGRVGSTMPFSKMSRYQRSE